MLGSVTATGQDAGIQSQPPVSSDSKAENSKQPEPTEPTEPTEFRLPEIGNLTAGEQWSLKEFNSTTFEQYLTKLEQANQTLSSVTDYEKLDDYEKELFTNGKPLIQGYLGYFKGKPFDRLTDKEKFILVAFIAQFDQVGREYLKRKSAQHLQRPLEENMAKAVGIESWEDRSDELDDSFGSDESDESDVSDGEEDDEDYKPSHPQNFHHLPPPPFRGGPRNAPRAFQGRYQRQQQPSF